MTDYEHILVDGQEIITITLNRPEIHNPFDDKMIAELTACFNIIQSKPDARAVIITGAGRSFCAGADLNWMKRMGQYSLDENLADAGGLSAMFQALEDIEIPTIARINGAALGGGAGLVCACDFAIASEHVKIGFSEVKLGLLPGVISPYVIDRIGGKKAVQLFTTGERLAAEDALKVGLVDKVVSLEGLDLIISQLIKQILSGGPKAVKECKRLARAGVHMERDEFKKYCISAIAQIRASPEGKEGVGSFLEKREPAWRD
ncbi:MAG: enoyl-CoA hydratase/isomerase family protein [Thermoplasmata archaeon]|nr:enoyl-CoA hydratase/isomerase family protein [Thermoplasmata archaeon]